MKDFIASCTILLIFASCGLSWNNLYIISHMDKRIADLEVKELENSVIEQKGRGVNTKWDGFLF